MKEDYFSTRFEPAIGGQGSKRDPAEITASEVGHKQDETSTVRDSIKNEPAITGNSDQAYFGEWIARKRSECSLPGNLSVAFLAAIMGGPFAILGAFMASGKSWYGPIYIVLFGPVVEELLKQSGMIYLLEKKPYRVFAGWQFVFSAIVSALTFATIENLIYIHVYVDPETLKSPEMFAYFRWTVCTALHVCCSIIASLGMIRVWRRQLSDGKAADLSVGYNLFLIAIAVHGIYNFAAMFFEDLFAK